MNTKIWKSAAAVCLTSAMVAGCSNAPASNGNAAATGGADLGDTVKVGLNFELSGPTADYGTKERNGAAIAIEQFNAREDKPFTVEGVEIDNKGEPAEAVTATTKLIEQDQVAGVVGPATSGCSIATFDFSTAKQVPVVAPSATQVGATLKPDGSVYEFAWRVCFEDSFQGQGMAEYAFNTLGIKKVVIINEVSDYGNGVSAAFKEKFVELGGEVLDETQYQSGDKDFASFVTKIKDLDFDGVYVAGYYNEAAQIVKAIKAEGIDKPIIGADGFDSQDFIDQVDAKTANNIFYTTAYTAIDPSEELTKFIADYNAKYGEDPSMFAALSYDATNLLLQALETSGKTGADLNEAIKNIEFSGITGSFSFDQTTHTPEKNVLVVELVDGVQSNVESVKVE